MPAPQPTKVPQNGVVYQWLVTGSSGCGWKFEARSGVAFKSREDANSYLPGFLARCADPDKINNLILDTARAELRELEVYESSTPDQESDDGK